MRAEGLKSRILQGVHRAIYRYWVEPLQRRISDLSIMEPGWRRKILLGSTLLAVNLGRLAITDFRLHVRRWRGEKWSIVYIGAGFSFEELCHILFPTLPEVESLGRVFLWQAPALAERFASQDDLVVCELNPLVRWRPRGGYVFTVPGWIQQVLDIAQPMENILADMNQNRRRNVRKVEEHGFTYIFTQAREDLDMFYDHMYCPYMQRRHGTRTSTSDRDALYRQYRQGGLILVKRSQEPICGMLCRMEGDTCEAGPMGVHEEHFNRVKEGSNVALWWFMLDWARRNHAHYFDFGSSRAQMNSGVFQFKRQWGTRVTGQRDLETEWIFYSKALPLCLRDHLNEQGFISEVDRRFYRVMLMGPGEELSDAELAHKRDEAACSGLDGVLLIFPRADSQPSLCIYQLVARVA